MFEGAKLAADNVNNNGGLLGKKIELVRYDDQNDPNESQKGLYNLISEGVELVIGPLSSTCTGALVDIANDEEIVMITGTATNDALDTEDNYVFRTCYKDSFQGAIGAAYAYQLGIRKAGIIYCASDTYSKGLADSFEAACARYGVEIAAKESTPSLTYTEYTNQFQAMINSGAELVYTPYYYDVIGPYVINQGRAAGFEGIIMGADGYDGTLDYIVKGSNLADFNGVYWNNHFDPASDNETVQQFVSVYQETYNGKTPNALSALSYDSMLVFAKAIETAGAEDAESVRDVLADTSVVYEGVTGTFSLDETGAAAKGATILEFYYDEAEDAVKVKPIDVITELP